MDAFDRRLRATVRRRHLKEQAVAYLGGKCICCGYDKCSAAFDMHHIDDRTKDFNISDRRAWNEALRLELDKCVLLCANCHREVHAGLHPHLLELERSGFSEGFDHESWEDLQTS